MAKKISHYDIIKPLGAGGMGVVQQARDPRLDRLVAIKQLSPELTSDATAKARFFQEARAASALDHPNICAIYEIDETADGQVFIVMAHYDGDSLSGVIADGPPTLAEALALALQLTDGLAKAHSHDITHRDIKPANVFVTGDGVVKILDFGLAKMAGATQLTLTGHTVGSPAYMAPEQVNGEAVDHRTDIWATGVLLFELVTGTLPFRGEHPHAQMYQILNEAPASLTDVAPNAPEGLTAIIARCLQKKPEDRYQKITELREELRQLLVSLSAEHADTALFTSGTIRAGLRTSQRGYRRPMRGLGRIIAATALVAIAVAAFFGVRNAQRVQPGDAMRVLVLPPQVEAATDDFDATRFVRGARQAATRTLLSLQGIDPVDGAGYTPGGNLSEIATETATDEILATTLQAGGGEWQMTVQRQRPDGSIISAETFDAAIGDPLAVSRATTVYVRSVFGEFDAASESNLLDTSVRDYQRYLNAYDAYWNEPSDSVHLYLAMADSLAALRQASPGLLDSYELEAKICRYLYDLTGNSSYVDRALSAVSAGLGTFGDDPTLTALQFELAVRKGELTRAETSLQRLRAARPGSLDILVWEAVLAEERGDLDEALRIRRQVNERRPSPVHLQYLAILEFQLGRYQDCRTHLEELIANPQTTAWATSKLAELELQYGSLSRAESLYTELIEVSAGPAELGNRGLAQMLAGNYRTASESFRAALSLSPDDPRTILNLAECESAFGNASEAETLYRRALGAVGELTATNQPLQMVAAQCHAHLGNATDAVRIVQDVLQTAGDDAFTLYEAAVVYAVVGERTNALVSAQRAVDKGVTPRWFSLPFFANLRDNPDFQALISAVP